MGRLRKTDNLLMRLAGGDLRSVGDADWVARRARGDPVAIAELVRGLIVDDPVVRMRAADALEKATREAIGSLASHKAAILKVLDASDQAEVRWQLIQCLPRFAFTKKELSEIIGRLIHCFNKERSRIVRVNCLQALFDLSPGSPEGVEATRLMIMQGLTDPNPSVRARARKLEKRLSGTDGKGIAHSLPNT